MNARSRGPGPGAYILPSTVGFTEHDVRKQRRPQYSFGTRHANLSRPIGPGSGAYCIKNVTRYGLDGTPKYTMRPQTYTRERSRGPGPAAHDVHLKPFFKGTKAPAYSLHSKNSKITQYVVSPAPNTYNVKVHLTKPIPPAYSMRKDWNTKLKPRSPGPATYGRTDLNVKLKKSPAFSLTGRSLYTHKPFTPGPNAYDRTYFRPGRTAPVYSFGVRHSEFAPPLIVPCDNIN